jgi:hypothetical protein
MAYLWCQSHIELGRSFTDQFRTHLKLGNPDDAFAELRLERPLLFVHTKFRSSQRGIVVNINHECQISRLGKPDGSGTTRHATSQPRA